MGLDRADEAFLRQNKDKPEEGAQPILSAYDEPLKPIQVGFCVLVETYNVS
jgi:hypothetical protein